MSSDARVMPIISDSSLVIGLVLGFVRESKTLEIGTAVLRLGYIVIGILAAIPVADAHALIRVRNLRVTPLNIPGLEVESGIEEPHIDNDIVRIDLFPNFHRLHLLTLHGLIAAHGAALKLIRMNHQFLPVPEADGVPLGQRIPVCLWRMPAPVGIDSADLVSLLGEQVGLIRRDHLFPQEWLCQPAGKAGRTASAQILIVDQALGGLLLTTLQLGHRHRRQLRCHTSWAGTEVTLAAAQTVPKTVDTIGRPYARPLGQGGFRLARGLFLQGIIEVLKASVLEGRIVLALPLGGGLRRPRRASLS